jgi:GxxExxY protein
MNVDQLSHIVIGAALRIHSGLGPGLFENVYEIVLFRDLLSKGLSVERQKPVTFTFDGYVFDRGFLADLVVEGQLLIEVKSIRQIGALEIRQTMTYVRLMDLRLGLILNFGAPSMRDGIKRIVNSKSYGPTGSPLRTL